MCRSSLAWPDPFSRRASSIRVIRFNSVIYCLVYIPPRSSDKYFQELFEFLTSFNATDDLVLLGDFNFNDINWESLYGFTPHSAKFCEIIFDLNLCQLISEPTHIHGNILDLVLTNNPDQLFDLTVHSTQLLSISSDHYVITFKIYSKNICSSNQLKTKLKNFSRGDSFEGLCTYLSNCDFSYCYQSDDIEFVWCFISSVIKEAIDLFVPSTVVHHDH